MHGIDGAREKTTEEFVKVAQEQWIRTGKGGVEFRYQIPGRPPTDEEWKLLEAIGYVKPISLPAKLDLWGAKGITFIVPGATVPAVKRRIATLIAEIQKIDVPWNVVFLGSARPLDPTKEGEEALRSAISGLTIRDDADTLAFPKIEAEMLVYLWRRHKTPNGSAAFVSSPNPRANTTETTKQWLEEFSPLAKGSSIFPVVVSNQPYVDYQALAIGRTIGVPSHLHVIADLATRTLPIATFLDNIAKQLFEEERLAERRRQYEHECMVEEFEPEHRAPLGLYPN